MDFLGENTGLYFFSAVFQGNMALLALVGVFAVFKIQQLNSSLQQHNEYLIKTIQDRLSFELHDGYTMPFPCQIVNDIPDISAALQQVISKHGTKELIGLAAKSLQTDEGTKKMLEKSQNLANMKKKIKADMKKPIISTLSVAVFSLVWLPFVHGIHFACTDLEMCLIIVAIALNIV